MDLQKSTVKPTMQLYRMKDLIHKKSVQQIAIAVAAFIIIYGFVATSIVPKRYNLNAGDIATADITAPKEIIDEEQTNKLIEQATKDIKIYTRDGTAQQDAIKTVNAFFDKASEIRKLSNVEKDAKEERMKSESPINLANDDYMTAVTASDSDLTTLKSEIIKNLNVIFEQQINDNDEDLKSKKQDFSYAITNLKLNRELRDLGTNIGFVVIKPNMIFDSKETSEKIEAAKKSITPVKYKKNQIIVKKNEVVTDGQLLILQELGLLEQHKKIDILLYIGIGIIVALLEGLVIIYLYRFYRDVLDNVGRLILISIIAIIILLFAKFVAIYNVSGYLIPMALASMLISILIKPRLAVVINIALSGLVALMTGYNIDTLIIALIGGSAGAIMVSRMHQRSDLISAGLAISLVDALAILGIGLINSADLSRVTQDSLLGVLNGALSSVLTIGLLPFCETTFGIVTPIKLLELSNPNQPVLKKLLFDAPGTYHHSIIVGNLSEAAVDAIGGNSILARVGSYYHDIGKLKRPYFFKENQLTNDNPHDKIAPSLSTLIITNHIKDGIEIAKKYKLPGIIRDIIEQHHGTTLVKYFYIKAVNDNDVHDEVTEAQFRYDGPKPQIRENAIIMLADSVEAAVRSIPSPSKSKIEDMVKKIVKEKLDDGQLDECGLTMKDLNTIISVFLSILNGIYHDRIEYPDMITGAKGGVDDVSNVR
jgi:uncharacterized domain HDIG